MCMYVCVSVEGKASSPAESGSFHTAASIDSQSLDSSTEVEEDIDIEVCYILIYAGQSIISWKILVVEYFRTLVEKYGNGCHKICLLWAINNLHFREWF